MAHPLLAFPFFVSPQRSVMYMLGGLVTPYHNVHVNVGKIWELRRKKMSESTPSPAHRVSQYWPTHFQNRSAAAAQWFSKVYLRFNCTTTLEKLSSHIVSCSLKVGHSTCTIVVFNPDTILLQIAFDIRRILQTFRTQKPSTLEIRNKNLTQIFCYFLCLKY